MRVDPSYDNRGKISTFFVSKTFSLRTDCDVIHRPDVNNLSVRVRERVYDTSDTVFYRYQT